MKFALIIREGSFEVSIGPESQTEQTLLQLLYNAAMSTRGDISVRANIVVGGPDRLWITIRNRTAEGQSDA